MAKAINLRGLRSCQNKGNNITYKICATILWFKRKLTPVVFYEKIACVSLRKVFGIARIVVHSTVFKRSGY